MHTTCPKTCCSSYISVFVSILKRRAKTGGKFRQKFQLSLSLTLDSRVLNVYRRLFRRNRRRAGKKQSYPIIRYKFCTTKHAETKSLPFLHLFLSSCMIRCKAPFGFEELLSFFHLLFAFTACVTPNRKSSSFLSFHYLVTFLPLPSIWVQNHTQSEWQDVHISCLIFPSRVSRQIQVSKYGLIITTIVATTTKLEIEGNLSTMTPATSHPLFLTSQNFLSFSLTQKTIQISSPLTTFLPFIIILSFSLSLYPFSGYDSSFPQTC